MTADGGESSPISATRSGLVPAKGGAGKGRWVKISNVWVTAKPAIPERTECPAWAHVTLVTLVMFFVVCMPPFAFACASCVMVKYFMSRHKVLLPPLPLSPVDGEELHVQLQSTFATLP